MWLWPLVAGCVDHPACITRDPEEVLHVEAALTHHIVASPTFSVPGGVIDASCGDASGPYAAGSGGTSCEAWWILGSPGSSTITVAASGYDSRTIAVSLPTAANADCTVDDLHETVSLSALP